MHLRFVFILALLIGTLARADSGGPYEGVPDLRQDESPPIFRIPATKEPLRFYIQHIPKMRVNAALSEPDSYSWEKIGGHHASFRVLGHVRGREFYEVRYVSQERIDQGLDFADTIIILARGVDSGPDESKLEVIYFSTGGPSYDRRATYLPKGDKYGAVKITDWWSGTGPGRWRNVYLRGTEDFKYESFTPDNP
jgi:hypothetical protein